MKHQGSVDLSNILITLLHYCASPTEMHKMTPHFVGRQKKPLYCQNRMPHFYLCGIMMIEGARCEAKPIYTTLFLSFFLFAPNVVHTFYNILICPFKKESCGRYSVQLITTLNMSSQFMHLIGFIICHVSPELCTFMYFYLFFVSNVFYPLYSDHQVCWNG